MERQKPNYVSEEETVLFYSPDNQIVITKQNWDTKTGLKFWLYYKGNLLPQYSCLGYVHTLENYQKEFAPIYNISSC